jgi:hypothetical protein
MELLYIDNQLEIKGEKFPKLLSGLSTVLSSL